MPTKESRHLKNKGKIYTAIFIRPDQFEALRSLRDETGKPTAELIRRAIDIALKEERARINLLKANGLWVERDW